MKHKGILAGLLLCLCAMAGCVGGSPSSSGNPYEVLVVINDADWDAPVGNSLRTALDVDVPGLPQSEPSFRVMHTNMESFTSMLKLVRNIIVVDIKDIYTKGSFKFSRNVYANPQIILRIQAPNKEEFSRFVQENAGQIVDFFTKVEMNRQVQVLKKRHAEGTAKKLDSIFGCDVWIPVELGFSKTGEKFHWASSSANTFDRNFVIYSFPYRDVETFTKEYLVHKRDSVMKVNIPGFKEGVYMSTDTLFTSAKAVSVKGKYAMEVRGLWRMKGDAMGGPFVSLARLNEEKQEVVVAEVFVYAPERPKRNLLRQMEASLYTLVLPGETGNGDEMNLGMPQEEQKKQE